jgi:hypothetical protein
MHMLVLENVTRCYREYRLNTAEPKKKERRKEKFIELSTCVDGFVGSAPVREGLS